MTSRRVARPAVLRSIPLDRHAVVEASAGTGKTFTLEHLIVELLLTADATLDRMLVVTFTEKATHELRARVRAKLEELLSGGGTPATDAHVRDGDFWTIDDAARAKLARGLHAFDGATIATIHAFCQRVLRENAFGSGRLFEEQHVDGRDAFARAMRDALRNDIAPDRARARWLEAALAGGRSIADLEALLWECTQARGDLRPFFDAAALDAALEGFPVDAARRTSGPAEMQGWGLPANTAKAVGRRLYEIADAVERARLRRSTPAFVLEAANVDLKFLVGRLPPTPPRPGPAADLCVAALALARATPPFDAALARAALGAVRTQLARRKREAGQYDFDDMLLLVDEALRGPRAAALAGAMRERWRYALIDEFQDTDETQWSIFRRAFFAHGGARSTLYLVGDPKQSIYRFRGADVHTYLRAREEVAADGGALVSLDRNYRATADLVGALNAFFDPEAAEPVFSGDVAYTPVACGRPESAFVDGEGRPVSPVHAFRFFSGAGEAIPLAALGARIAIEIRAITDPRRPWRLDGRPLAPSDVFILTRTGREGRLLGAALREARVPHAFYKEDGLFRTDEARDVRALLLAIDDPTDRARRLAAWLTPFFGLPLAGLESARDLPPAHPLVAGLHAWKAMADARDFDRMFESVVRDSGVLRRQIFFADGERELTNYLHLVELLLEHARRTHATLRDLVNALSGFIDGTRLPLDLEGNVQRLESDRRAVQIMTIHKAKGLEAAVVFVAGGFSQPPGDRVRVYHDDQRRLAWVGTIDDADVEARAKKEEREEEQRLMYVALTRAKARLYLPCAVDDGASGKGKRGRGDAKALRGPYEIVNRRVLDLARQGEPWLTVEDVAPAAPPRASSRPGAAEAPWSPPARLLQESPDGAPYARLRERHAPVLVTSYTRMKGERSRRPAGDGLDERRAEKAADSIDEVAATTLRSTRASGVFLHELLERVPLASFGAGGLDVWRARRDVSALFDEALAVHRVDPAQRAHAEALVWTGYTTPLDLPGGGRIEALASAGRVAREMDFVFPIAGAGALSSSPPPSGAADEPGFVRGSLDLAFRHGGATYFVDWKSDSLRGYAHGELALHVQSHYHDQATLYLLAVVKLLGVRSADEYAARFGGLLYCFLRGMNVPGEGVWSSRPTWEQVLAWEASMQNQTPWRRRGGE